MKKLIFLLTSFSIILLSSCASEDAVTQDADAAAAGDTAEYSRDNEVFPMDTVVLTPDPDSIPADTGRK